MRKLLKILTFTIVTLTAFVLIFKPELVRTMIPGILEKIYVTINNVIPIEREDDLKLSIIAVAIIMPIFAGIMRFISDFDATGIKGALMPFVLIVICFVTGPVGILLGGFIIYVLFSVPSLFVVISYIYCCFLMFSDSVESRYSSSSSGYSSYGSSSSSSSEYSSSGSSSSSSDSGTISNEEWWEVVDLTEHMKQEYGEDYFKDL